MAMINYADKVALNSNSGIADINKCNATDMNEIKSVFNNQVAQGWYKTGLNPTFTFVSWDSTTYTGVVSTNIDLTPYLNVGMKVKFTQNSAIKYAFITAITSNSITLFLGTDYSINNSAISNTYYSMLKAPFGFPMDKNKWRIIYVDTTARTSGGTAVKNTYYNPGGLNFKFPIGLWDFSYQCYFGAYAGSTATQIKIQMALSTSPTSVSDVELLSYTETGMRSGTGNIIEVGLGSRSKEIKLTSPTTYYPIIQNVLSTVPGNMYFYNSDAPMIVKAVCGYL